MAVLVTAEVPGQTEQGYDGMLVALEGLLKHAAGFVLHSVQSKEAGAHWKSGSRRSKRTSGSPKQLLRTFHRESTRSARSRSSTV